MGLGDEIMAAGQAAAAARQAGRPVAIRDAMGQPRRHELWDGNPAIVQAGRPGAKAAPFVVNAAGCRPYLRYPWRRDSGPQLFTAWRARDHRATIHFTPAEEIFATHVAPLGRFVVIEPNIKPRANPNKDWGFARYQALVETLPDVRFVQLGDPSDARPRLAGVATVATPTIRHACAILARAAAYVGAEGALHHAAAALRRPAVVIFGGAVPPATLGYEDHVNLAADRACGSWLPCDHCRAAMAAITPASVAEALSVVLSSGVTATRERTVA